MKMTHSGAESRIKRISGCHGFQNTGYEIRDIRATQHTGYKIRDIRAIRLIRDSSWGDVDGIIEEMNEVLAV